VAVAAGLGLVFRKDPRSSDQSLRGQFTQNALDFASQVGYVHIEFGEEVHFDIVGPAAVGQEFPEPGTCGVKCVDPACLQVDEDGFTLNTTPDHVRVRSEREGAHGGTSMQQANP
jgi:hypothetical protein